MGMFSVASSGVVIGDMLVGVDTIADNDEAGELFNYILSVPICTFS
jgi:hypothetical protein